MLMRRLEITPLYMVHDWPMLHQLENILIIFIKVFKFDLYSKDVVAM